MKMMSWSRYHCLSPSLLRKPRKFSRRDLRMLGIRRCRGELDSPLPEGEAQATSGGRSQEARRSEASATAKRRVRGYSPSIDRNPPPQPSPDGRGSALGSLRDWEQIMVRYFRFVIRRFRT